MKSDLYDGNLKFQKDELGRTMFNERQLVDWAITKARNEEEFENYQQIASQMLERKRMVFDQAWKVLEQNLVYAYNKAEQEKDFALKAELADMKRRFEEKRQRMAAEAQASGAMWSTIGGIVGAGAGLYLGWGNPAAAAAGAAAGQQLGSGLGQMAYSKSG
jgi:hypothetical protein